MSRLKQEKNVASSLKSIFLHALSYFIENSKLHLQVHNKKLLFFCYCVQVTKSRSKSKSNIVEAKTANETFVQMFALSFRDFRCSEILFFEGHHSDHPPFSLHHSISSHIVLSSYHQLLLFHVFSRLSSSASRVSLHGFLPLRPLGG